MINRFLEEGLINSNRNIGAHNEELYKLIEENVANPRSHERAIIWQPKSSSIKKESGDIFRFIETIKPELKNDKWDELYKKLKKYKENVMAIDPQLKAIFRKDVDKLTQPFDSLKQLKGNFYDLFGNVSLLITQIFLTKLQNDITLNENKMVIFCYFQTQSNYERYYKTSVLIGQNKSHLHPGEDLEITAGIGSYSVASQPKIQIDGKRLAIRENGTAFYKFKVPDETGKHIKQIKINYIDQDGTNNSGTFNIDYIIEN